MIKILLLFIFLTFTVFSSEKPTLTIYTYDAFATSWGPGPKIKAAFEEEHACNIKFVGLSSSIVALRKIQLEGKRSKADILLGLDTSIAQVAKKTGLFAPHGLDNTKLSLPVTYIDDVFTPFDYSYFAFVYNSDKVKNIPDSFEALATMPKDFKVVMQDPRSSTPGLGLLLWVKSIYGDKSGEYWERLAPYILTVTKGWSEAYSLFLKDEADMVLSYTTSPAYHMVEEKREDIQSATFKEGHYGQIEVAAILKRSKHQELAKEFLAFMHTQKFAEIIPTANWAYPVIEGVKLHEAFSKLHRPEKMILMDGKSVQKQRKAIIDEWLEAIQK